MKTTEKVSLHFEWTIYENAKNEIFEKVIGGQSNSVTRQVNFN